MEKTANIWEYKVDINAIIASFVCLWKCRMFCPESSTQVWAWKYFALLTKTFNFRKLRGRSEPKEKHYMHFVVSSEHSSFLKINFHFFSDCLPEVKSSVGHSLFSSNNKDNVLTYLKIHGLAGQRNNYFRYLFYEEWIKRGLSLCTFRTHL